MRHIVVISTGGTIASRWQGDGYAAEAAGKEVLAAGAVPEGVDVRVVDLFTVNSSRLTTDAPAAAAARRAGGAGRPGRGRRRGHARHGHPGGVRLLRRPLPRRPPAGGLHRRPAAAGREDGDAAGNLYDALLTAATGRDIGAVIVFAGQVFAARGTVKQHTVDARAFGTPDGLPLGRVEFGRVTWGRRRPRPEPLPMPEVGVVPPRVDIVMHHSDGDTVLFDASSAAGAQGVVLVGTGSGERQPAGRRGSTPGGGVRGPGRGQHPGGGGCRGPALHRRRSGRPGGGRSAAGRAPCAPARRGSHCSRPCSRPRASGGDGDGDAAAVLRRVLEAAPQAIPASELYLVDGVGK